MKRGGQVFAVAMFATMVMAVAAHSGAAHAANNAANTANAAPSKTAPAAGRYAAQLCVATSSANAECGPAEVELRASGVARVRVADIVYRLQLKSSQVEVVLTQGSMQLDEFVADYEWVGRSLKFSDNDKNARYEVKLGERR